MKNLVETLKTNFEAFVKDAGQRARKVSLDIEKALKEFRKISIDNSKK